MGTFVLFLYRNITMQELFKLNSLSIRPRRPFRPATNGSNTL